MASVISSVYKTPHIKQLNNLQYCTSQNKNAMQYQIFRKQLISQEHVFFNKMKSITVNYVYICVSNELPREGEQPAVGEKAKDSIWTVAQFSHATDSILNYTLFSSHS